MKVTFLRRQLLGAGSIRGMVSAARGQERVDQRIRVIRGFAPDFDVFRADRLDRRNVQQALEGADWVVRWGCTARLPVAVPLERQLNPSPAIQRVNDKRGFRLLCQENLPDITPRTFANGLPLPQDEELPEALVLRPAHHAQGRNLWYIERPTAEGLAERVRIQNALQGGWYASEYIPKVSEHRVYVANSRVVTVARKTPENPDAVAWNVAQGGRFDVVNWDGWDLGLCRNAVRVAALAETDFCGVDMMTDEDGHSWVIEANSAPSLPPLSDGRVSYRQKALMKAFQWTFDNGKQTLETPEVPENWRDVIHPAIWSR